MAKRHLRLVTSAAVNRTVRPKRPPNADLRTREYLTEAEVERLMNAAKRNRWGHRDATMILVAYRHGLRASELTDLRSEQVDFRTATLHVRRVKQGTPSTHPILGDELRALRRPKREQEPKSAYVFVSERGDPFSTAGFARVVERVGVGAKLGFKVHPHMLRHACGYALANKGHDTRALQAYLGHRNIQHTVRYTELSPTRFKDFWRAKLQFSDIKTQVNFADTRDGHARTDISQPRLLDEFKGVRKAPEEETVPCVKSQQL
jgi:site-specific recombinase XerD